VNGALHPGVIILHAKINASKAKVLQHLQVPLGGIIGVTIPAIVRCFRLGCPVKDAGQEPFELVGCKKAWRSATEVQFGQAGFLRQ
jgi:hypothetical protein